jgi:hypothetical protein
MIKKWPNDARVGCDGKYMSKNMIYFLTLESFMIEENNKFIEEQGLFEEGLDLDFLFFANIFIHFGFLFLYQIHFFL